MRSSLPLLCVLSAAALLSSCGSAVRPRARDAGPEVPAPPFARAEKDGSAGGGGGARPQGAGSGVPAKEDWSGVGRSSASALGGARADEGAGRPKVSRRPGPKQGTGTATEVVPEASPPEDESGEKLRGSPDSGSSGKTAVKDAGFVHKGKEGARGAGSGSASAASQGRRSSPALSAGGDGGEDGADAIPEAGAPDAELRVRARAPGAGAGDLTDEPVLSSGETMDISSSEEGDFDLPPLSGLQTELLDVDLPGDMMVDSYRVQIASSADFTTLLFNYRFDGLGGVSIYDRFMAEGRGPKTAGQAVWVRYAVLDLLGFQMPFSAPRRYSLRRTR